MPPTELRPLSVREYARIQKFPDHWKFEGKTADCYRQIGNAVPTPLGCALDKCWCRWRKGMPKVNAKRMRGTSVHRKLDQPEEDWGDDS